MTTETPERPPENAAAHPPPYRSRRPGKGSKRYRFYGAPEFDPRTADEDSTRRLWIKPDKMPRGTQEAMARAFVELALARGSGRVEIVFPSHARYGELELYSHAPVTLDELDSLLDGHAAKPRKRRRT